MVGRTHLMTAGGPLQRSRSGVAGSFHTLALVLAAGIALLAGIAGGTVATKQLAQTRDNVVRTLQALGEEPQEALLPGSEKGV